MQRIPQTHYIVKIFTQYDHFQVRSHTQISVMFWLFCVVFLLEFHKFSLELSQ